jgi:DNA-binding NarL/FixJ family response regulator
VSNSTVGMGGVGLGPGTARRSEEMLASGLLPAQRSPLRDIPATPLRMATILVVDPDRATREPLRTSLAEIGVGRILEAPSVAAVEDLVVRQVSGDLALVSLQLGPEASRLIHALREAGWPRVIALAPTAEIGPVIDAVGAGVSGVLIGRRANPAAASIPSTIHDLSTREIEVIRLVADGRSNKWIGEQLSLSALTVKSHLARIGRKLGTGDRAHMVALAMRAGVIS